MAWVDGKTGKDIVVDLNLNRDLIPESYAERYHHQVKDFVELDSVGKSDSPSGRKEGYKDKWIFNLLAEPSQSLYCIDLANQHGSSVYKLISKNQKVSMCGGKSAKKFMK